MVVATLKSIGMMIGGFFILLLIFIAYATWLDKRKEKAFAACTLGYIQANPKYKVDLSNGELARQPIRRRYYGQVCRIFTL